MRNAIDCWTESSALCGEPHAPFHLQALQKNQLTKLARNLTKRGWTLQIFMKPAQARPHPPHLEASPALGAAPRQ